MPKLISQLFDGLVFLFVWCMMFTLYIMAPEIEELIINSLK